MFMRCFASHGHFRRSELTTASRADVLNYTVAAAAAVAVDSSVRLTSLIPYIIAHISAFFHTHTHTHTSHTILPTTILIRPREVVYCPSLYLNLHTVLEAFQH